MHRLEMLQSPAWRLLNRAERRVLERMEIENMRGRGKENGSLICTYDNLVEYGIRRPSIARAIRAVTTAGFIEITQRGWRSAGTNRRPAKYRLTYLPTWDAQRDRWIDPTDDWRTSNSTAESFEVAA